MLFGQLNHILLMEPNLAESLRFPVGRHQKPAVITPALRQEWLDYLEAFPQTLAATLANLGESDLDRPYRPGGWTVRQVVHHLADSHLNAYVRTKLALTEASPTIKPYDQDGWANLPDSRLPVAVSLQLLEAVHQRWLVVLRSVTAWQTPYIHPDFAEPFDLDGMLSLYHWHSRHHLAHIGAVALG